MASTSTITSSGLGSGLDVDALVSKLIAADRSAQDTKLDKTESKTNVQISALGTLKSAMSTLQTALSALTAGGDLAKRSVAVSDSSILTATTNKSAHAGSTQVEVQQLAAAHKLGSSAFASGSALTGAGDMSFTVGSNSFTVSMTATSTVANLRDAINQAADNVGVSAALIAEDGGTRLVLTAKNTGTANAITVNTALTSFADLQAPSDAIVKVDGYTRTSAYNRISNVVDGVSIDLARAAVGTKVNLVVSNDDSAAASAVGNFVDAYNALAAQYAKLTGYDASTKTAGALMGDASIRSSQSALRNVLGSVMSGGTYKSLADIGITTNTDGTLQLDASKLAVAISSDSDSIGSLFGDATNGIAKRMNDLVAGYTRTNGQIDSRLDTLDQALEKVADDRTALDGKMTRQEALYRSKFNALDSIVSKYKNVASYLDQMDNERYNQKANS